MFYFDSNYFLLVVIPGLLLSVGSQFFLSTTYGRWSNRRNSRGWSGAEIGNYLVRNSQLNNVTFEGVGGNLTDHYDPSSHTVRMSDGVANQPSVASMAIVAHELGHAEQHQQHSPLIAMRTFLVPAMRISPNVATVLIMAGLLLQFTGLIWVGIAFFAVVVAFMVLTLPVEFDASIRGLRLLRETGALQTDEESSGARMVLIAAALTYVAAAVQSVLQLAYFLSLVGVGRRND